jgi:hypothetical protein
MEATKKKIAHFVDTFSATEEMSAHFILSHGSVIIDGLDR